jgi:hypothetical protein
MGLFLDFCRHPTPSVDRADDRLPALIDMDVLNSHLLLTLAAITLQRRIT